MQELAQLFPVRGAGISGGSNALARISRRTQEVPRRSGLEGHSAWREEVIHGARRLPLPRLSDVRVEVEGDPDRGVSEEFGGGFGMNSPAPHQGPQAPSTLVASHPSAAYLKSRSSK